MSTGGDESARFEPSEDSLVIIQALRDNGFGWIGEELETTFRRGQLVQGTGGYEQRPIDGAEQDRITLRALQNYFVTLHHAWEDSQGRLNEAQELEIERIMLITEAGEQIETFAGDYRRERNQFDTLLSEAWPNGVERYTDSD